MMLQTVTRLDLYLHSHQPVPSQESDLMVPLSPEVASQLDVLFSLTELDHSAVRQSYPLKCVLSCWGRPKQGSTNWHDSSKKLGFCLLTDLVIVHLFVAFEINYICHNQELDLFKLQNEQTSFIIFSQNY